MRHFRCRRHALLCLSLLFAAAARGQTPKWIWSSTNNTSTQKEVRFFRKTFTVKQPLLKAALAASGDDRADFFINGKKIASVNDWKAPAQVDVTKNIVVGENVIAARCENEESSAGLIAQLDMTIPTSAADPRSRTPPQAGLRSVKTLVTDSTWFWSDHEAPNWNRLD